MRVIDCYSFCLGIQRVSGKKEFSLLGKLTITLYLINSRDSKKQLSFRVDCSVINIAQLEEEHLPLYAMSLKKCLMSWKHFENCMEIIDQTINILRVRFVC